MLRIAIVDDDRVVCSQIERILLDDCAVQNRMVEVEVFSSGESFLDALQTEQPFSLVFLDIELLHMNGIEVGTILRSRMDTQAIQFVYISAQEAYAMQLFRTRPFDFLVKPLTAHTVLDVFYAYLNAYPQQAAYLQYTVDRKPCCTKLSDVLYLQSNRKKVIITTCTTQIETYGKMTDLLRQITQPPFLQIHRCYAVNPMHITAFTHEYVELTNGERLYISRALRNEIRDS